MRKIIFTFFIVLATTLTTNALPSWIGDGLSESTAYQIWTLAQLEELSDSIYNSNFYRDKYYILMEDIIQPMTKIIGRTWGPYNLTPFKGTFLGNNKTIVVHLDYPDSNYVGLFGGMTSATITDLAVTGYVRGKERVGGIAGYAYNSTILRSINLANVEGHKGVGGIVGHCTGTFNTAGSLISHCINLGCISGRHVSGIIGCGFNPNMDYYIKLNVSNCINAGYIRGFLDIEIINDFECRTSGIGAIIGHNHKISTNVITNCIDIGVIDGEEYYDKKTGGGITGDDDLD